MSDLFLSLMVEMVSFFRVGLDCVLGVNVIFGASLSREFRTAALRKSTASSTVAVSSKLSQSTSLKLPTKSSATNFFRERTVTGSTAGGAKVLLSIEMMSWSLFDIFVILMLWTFDSVLVNM